MSRRMTGIAVEGMTDKLWSGTREVIDNGAHPNYTKIVKRNKVALCDIEALQLRVVRLTGIPVEVSPYVARALDTLTEESGRWSAAT